MAHRYSRRTFLAAGGSLFAAAARPNIIVIVADDLGSADVGFNGLRDFDTPHIDRLAASGVRFAQAYVTHPYCSPSRAGLLTGRYQQRFGHEHNPPARGGDRVGMSVDERTIADQLGEAGYATGWVGKWHLGDAPHFHPQRRGFRETFGFLGGGHDYWRSNAGEPIQRNGTPVEEREYLTDAFTREATTFIRRHRSAPFFLYVAYNAPHAPNQAPRAMMDVVSNVEYPQRAVYAAMVTSLDNGVGAIVKEAPRNTLIFFLSDNGGRHDGADNRPLRGFKGMLHEGGIRTPFVMSWPGHLKAGASDRVVSALDIMPTALAVAGAKPPAKPLDGQSLLSRAVDRPLFWRTSGGKGYAVRHGRYKLVKDIPMERAQLFDLAADPRETRDLSASMPDKLSELEALYRKWNSDMIEPLWTENHEDNIRRDYKAVRDARERALPQGSTKR